MSKSTKSNIFEVQMEKSLLCKNVVHTTSWNLSLYNYSYRPEAIIVILLCTIYENKKIGGTFKWNEIRCRKNSNRALLCEKNLLLNVFCTRKRIYLATFIHCCYWITLVVNRKFVCVSDAHWVSAINKTHVVFSVHNKPHTIAMTMFTKQQISPTY